MLSFKVNQQKERGIDILKLTRLFSFVAFLLQKRMEVLGLKLLVVFFENIFVEEFLFVEAF